MGNQQIPLLDKKKLGTIILQEYMVPQEFVNQRASLDAAVSTDAVAAPTIELVTPKAPAEIESSGCWPVVCDPCWPDTKCDPTDR